MTSTGIPSSSQESILTLYSKEGMLTPLLGFWQSISQKKLKPNIYHSCRCNLSPLTEAGFLIPPLIIGKV